jgi:hypothetical protein
MINFVEIKNNIMLYQSEFYHLTGTLLKEGSVILPGSFGIILNERYGNFEQHFGDPRTLLYEYQLEEFRQKNYPNKPSRFKGLFLCHSYDNMVNFVKKTTRFGQFGYKVELTEKTKPFHVGDWEKYDNRMWNQDVTNWRTKINESVKNYWEEISEDLSNPKAPIEILTESPVKIIQRVW